jgi:diketogulonate reductase-like aldo/keto reductase
MVAADDPVVMEDATLCEIAKKHSKTPQQVAIKFQLQRGLSVIPKSTTPARIEQNFDVFDFDISEDDMAALLKVDRHLRFCNPMIQLKSGEFVARDGIMQNFPFKDEMLRSGGQKEGGA